MHCLPHRFTQNAGISFHFISRRVMLLQQVGRSWWLVIRSNIHKMQFTIHPTFILVPLATYLCPLAGTRLEFSCNHISSLDRQPSDRGREKDTHAFLFYFVEFMCPVKIPAHSTQLLFIENKFHEHINHSKAREMAKRRFELLHSSISTWLLLEWKIFFS